MLKGRIREAVRWIIERSGGGLLDPADVLADGKTVFNVLNDKHPNPSYPGVIALPHLHSFPEFEDVDITAEVVEKVSRRLHGGGGPGGTQSDQWQDFLLHYGSKSYQLRQPVANLAMKLANSIVDWVDIRALMCNRLIALDKCPGVRPIGVGECLRRILGKCLIEQTGIDVTEACGAKQLCSGLRAGLEGAVHAFSSLFDDNASSGWGILLVDASNAFNSSNRIAALLNARVLWPRCGLFLFNSYRGCAPLFVRGSKDFLYSKEGVTQGDPLSMAFYGLSVLPLIDLLSDSEGCQSWFVDDSSCCARLLALRRWWDLLVLHGPSFGYHPERFKSILIVHPSFQEEASRLFGGLGISVVTGSRFLGGYIGDEEGKRSFLEEKVKEWTNCLKKLSEAAVSQPQAAFAAVTKSLQCEWGFIQRVISGSSEFFMPIQKAIEEDFLPSVLGSPISLAEASLFSLPAKHGGLGIRDLVRTGDLCFQTSQGGTLVLSKALKHHGVFDLNSHNAALSNSLTSMKSKRDEYHKKVLQQALDSLPPSSKRAIDRASNNKNSAWLTVMPLARHPFDLSANEFRDGLALRYMRPVLLPASCDGCGDAFDIDHALNCKTGGLILGRHNEIRDAIGDLAAQAWGHSNVWKEPIIVEANASTGKPGLQADLAVRGVWGLKVMHCSISVLLTQMHPLTAPVQSWQC